MNFVTKKEYDAAVLVLKKALQSKQLVSGYDQSIVTTMLFGGIDQYAAGIGLDKIDFVSPFRTAQAALHELRQEMQKQKLSVDNNRKVLDNLELLEKQLQALLPTLKE